MLTVSQQLSRQLGYHTPVEAIREKLLELYDLDALNRQEAQYAFRTRDARGDWLPDVHEEVFVLPGVPRKHGLTNDEVDGDAVRVNEQAIHEIWEAKDLDSAWFMDKVWERRLAEDNTMEHEKEESYIEASPAPSNAASATRRGRSARTSRMSEIKAEDDDNGEEEDEAIDGGEESGKGGQNARTSLRTKKKKIMQ